MKKINRKELQVLLKKDVTFQLEKLFSSSPEWQHHRVSERVVIKHNTYELMTKLIGIFNRENVRIKMEWKHIEVYELEEGNYLLKRNDVDFVRIWDIKKPDTIQGTVFNETYERIV